MLSRSLWPIHICTVRRSTPAYRQRVAKVARSLCNQKSSFLSFAGTATVFRQSRKATFGLQPFLERKAGGERGIRTPDTVPRIHAFEACGFNHSPISPRHGRPAVVAGAVSELPGRAVQPPRSVILNESGGNENDGRLQRGYARYPGAKKAGPCVWGRLVRSR